MREGDREMTYQQQLDKQRTKEQVKRERERDKLTRFICKPCKEANRTKSTHPGVMHQPGICDCPCR